MGVCSTGVRPTLESDIHDIEGIDHLQDIISDRSAHMYLMLGFKKIDTKDTYIFTI